MSDNRKNRKPLVYKSFLQGLKHLNALCFDRAMVSFLEVYQKAVLFNEGELASVMMHYICFCFASVSNPDGLLSFCDSERRKHPNLLETGIFAFYYSIACLAKGQYQKAAEIAESGIQYESIDGNLKIVHPVFYYEIAYRAYSALGL